MGRALKIGGIEIDKLMRPVWWDKGERALSQVAVGIEEGNASVALHQVAGFRVVGIRERIGQHRGRWRDLILIERRSPAVLPVRQDRAQQPHGETQPDTLAAMATATAHLAAGSAASIGSNATLTLPSRQYAVYRNPYT